MKFSPRTVIVLPTYSIEETEEMTGSATTCRAPDAEVTFKPIGLLQAIDTVQFAATPIIPTTKINLVGDKTLHKNESTAQTATEQLCASDGKKYSLATVTIPREYVVEGKNEELLAIEGEGHTWRAAFTIEMLVEVGFEKCTKIE